MRILLIVQMVIFMLEWCGPVRTGKSTFIKNFMDLLVIPNIQNTYKKERVREPKFVPNEAVEITIGENLKLKTRLVDCVGYLVNNALRLYGG